jgi:histidyl-tRNA synthetase
MSHQSVEPYKGVRDFYPEDLAVRKHILSTLGRVAESFGYEEYDASILEPADLYRGKTSEEIVNEQAYIFTDRGDREVMLRPEMTPTVARMVAARRRELGYPLRLWCAPNMFRYEKPQRGRLREFWQFNADVFGLSGIEADAEIIALGYHAMKAFGAQDSDFEIQINDRRAINNAFDVCGIDLETRPALMRLLDRKNKMTEAEFETALTEIVGAKAGQVATAFETLDAFPTLAELQKLLAQLGVKNARIAPEIVRGFDYYTGVIMEAVDTNPQNRRALYGGGRYDNLLTLFGQDPLPVVGFAIGDVTMKDFLEVHGLLDAYQPRTQLMLCVVDEAAIIAAQKLAQDLREKGVRVAVNSSLRKLPDQFKSAEKLSIRHALILGSGDNTDLYSIKTLGGDEQKMTLDEIVRFLLLKSLAGLPGQGQA